MSFNICSSTFSKEPFWLLIYKYTTYIYNNAALALLFYFKNSLAPGETIIYLNSLNKLFHCYGFYACFYLMFMNWMNDLIRPEQLFCNKDWPNLSLSCLSIIILDTIKNCLLTYYFSSKINALFNCAF